MSAPFTVLVCLVLFAFVLCRTKMGERNSGFLGKASWSQESSLTFSALRVCCLRWFSVDMRKKSSYMQTSGRRGSFWFAKAVILIPQRSLDLLSILRNKSHIVGKCVLFQYSPIALIAKVILCGFYMNLLYGSCKSSWSCCSHSQEAESHESLGLAYILFLILAYRMVLPSQMCFVS